MIAGRRKIAALIGLLFVSIVALGAILLMGRPSGKSWPPGSDEERLARSLAVLNREQNPNVVEEALDFFGIDFRRGQNQPMPGAVSQEIADRDGTKAIPRLIGAIDADSSYETTYNVGYHVLRDLTRVEYSPFHDGAWWRRWWDTHRHEYPAAVRDLPVPDFDKTTHGKNWVPIPADIDTLQGKLRLVPEAIERDRLYRRGVLQSLPYGLQDLAAEIAVHGDPRAIPYLIPLLDAHPPAVRQALRGLSGTDDQQLVEAENGKGEFRDPRTGKEYRDRFQPSWWREWWAAHRAEFPTAAAIDIPDYSQPLKFEWQEGEHDESAR